MFGSPSFGCNIYAGIQVPVLRKPLIYRVGSTTNGATSGTNITCNLPAGVMAGDFLIAIIHNNGTRTVADNNGSYPFTVKRNGAIYNGNSANSYVFFRVAGSSEPSSYSFTLSSSDRWSITILAYRNVDVTDPWLVDPSSSTENTNTGTSNTTLSLVIENEEAMAIAYFLNDSNTVTFSSGPGDSYNTVQNNSGEQLMLVADKLITSSGTQGAITATQNTTNGSWLNSHFALRGSGSYIEHVLEFTDGVGVSSSVLKQITKNPVESIVTATNIVKEVMLRKSDNVNASVVFAVEYITAKIFTETLALSTNITAVAVSIREFVESINVSSIFSRLLIKSSIFVENLVVSSVISGLASISKTLTLIYNILEFNLGLRVTPSFLSARKDQPSLVGAKKDKPELISGRTDKPTIISARKA